jgi:hypothetical protein
MTADVSAAADATTVAMTVLYGTQEWSTKASAPKEEAVKMAVVWTSELIERLQR